MIGAVDRLRRLVDELHEEEKRLASDLLRTTPQWTTEPPTEPGWYWGLSVDGVFMFSHPGGQIQPNVHYRDAACCGSEHTASHWMRIVPPEPPK